MHRADRLAGLVLLCVLLGMGSAAAQPTSDSPETATRKAQAAATEWLALVDDGDFGDSWESAAAPFRERIEEDEWEARGERLRDSLQARSRRTRTMVQYRDSLRSVPGGPFVILAYRSSFEGGRVEERLLTVWEDGTWKVVGYQVTPLRSEAARTPSLLDPGASP